MNDPGRAGRDTKSLALKRVTISVQQILEVICSGNGIGKGNARGKSQAGNNGKGNR